MNSEFAISIEIIWTFLKLCTKMKIPSNIYQHLHTSGVVSSISVTNFVIKVFNSFCNCLPMPLVEVLSIGILMSMYELVLVPIIWLLLESILADSVTSSKVSLANVSEAVDTVVVVVGVVVAVVTGLSDLKKTKKENELKVAWFRK